MKHVPRGATALFCLSLALPAAAQEGDGFLGTLVLTAGKRDLSFGSAVSRTVVDAVEIRDRQAATIAQLIDSVPGVTLVNGTTPQGSGINIRGFGANTTFGTDQKIAVQVDGASVGSEELYRIGTQLFTDPLLYREVEVLRGTIGSFAYGSGIVGGVVRLETKDPADFTGGVPGFGGSQSFEYASNGAGGGASSTNLAWQPTENAGFLLNYTWRTRDALTDGDGDEIGNSAFTTPSGLAKAVFTLGEARDHDLSFSFSRTVADDKDVPYDQFDVSGGAFGNVDRLVDTRQAMLEWAWTPASDLIDLTANLSHADQRIEMAFVPGSSTIPGPTPPGVVALATSDRRYETTKLTVSNRALFDTGAVAHDLTTGLELIRRIRADETSAPGGTDNRLALFAIDEMRLGGLTITPALRFETSAVESSEDFGRVENNALMGGLALGYDFDSGLSVFASAAYTEGLPIIDDLGAGAVARDRMRTTEKSQTFEIGAEYAGEGVFTAGDSFSIRGNVYDTRLWDITSYTVAGSMTEELAGVEMRGLELEASYGLENGVYFDLAGHVGEGEEINPDGSSATWRNLPADRVQLTAGHRFGETLDVSWEVVHAADRRESTGDALDPVTLHNLRATWRLDGDVLSGTELRAGIENLTDADYIGHLASPTRPAPGRTVKIALTKSF